MNVGHLRATFLIAVIDFVIDISLITVCLHHVARAAATAAPDRKTHIPHGAAETGRDEGPPAKGAAGAARIYTTTVRSDNNTQDKMSDISCFLSDIRRNRNLLDLD